MDGKNNGTPNESHQLWVVRMVRCRQLVSATPCHDILLKHGVLENPPFTNRCFSQLTSIYRGAPRVMKYLESLMSGRGCRSTGISNLLRGPTWSLFLAAFFPPYFVLSRVFSWNPIDFGMTSAKSLVLPSFQLSPAASTAPNHREDSPRPDNSCKAARCRRSQGGPGIGELRSLQTLTRHALFNQKTLGFKHNN